MVDFNNESTVATPPGEVVKIVVLERREQTIEALESYYLAEHSGIDTQLKERTVRARIMAFWFQIQAMVKRRTKDLPGTEEAPNYDMIEDAITKADKMETMIAAFEWMNEFVDDIGLTVIDSRARYDRTNVEDANSKKGL